MRIDTTAMETIFHQGPNSGNLNYAIKDNFTFTAGYSFKNTKENSNFFINVSVYNYDDIKQFIENEYNTNGHLPFEESLYDANKNELLVSERKIIVQPSIIQNESGDFEISKKDMKIIQIKYSEKDYQKNRKIVFYDKDNNIVDTYKLPDLNKNKAEANRKHQELKKDIYKQSSYL
ncbi:ABC-type antimicrobial peptide transport system permease subunit [Dysgonomonas hofstadii]|uniref:ABC-type antimicrobial peptide transport system permease subunit n=1 Tax=Dysgonomonas hofstadii TaxID=637886 RepID=A0A840CMC2_9BACT|nr:hypothetical protein [Dysgonomonas hofstadii]MBB4036536.1 ABC-type antimicrobial peptide transport system permease subunit [Dysgonomonas hofstadii]